MCILLNLKNIWWCTLPLGFAYKWNQSMTPYLQLFCRQVWVKTAARFFFSQSLFEPCLRDIMDSSLRELLSEGKVFISQGLWLQTIVKTLPSLKHKHTLQEGHGELTDQMTVNAAGFARAQPRPALSSMAQELLCVEGCILQSLLISLSLYQTQIPGKQNAIAHLLVRKNRAPCLTILPNYLQ